jgi:threonine aldolase
MLGGGMRQAGIVAAAGLHALDHHVDRLMEDHARAEQLAHALRSLGGLRVVQATNMVWVEAGDDPQRNTRLLDQLVAHLLASGVEVLDRRPLRLVTHLDFGDEQLAMVLDAIDQFGSQYRS